MITEALLVPDAGTPFGYQEIDVDDNLRGDEVLVEMKATDVCYTDLTFVEKILSFSAVFHHEGETFEVT
jgi:aryl-alcohol dehydrogenase